MPCKKGYVNSVPSLRNWSGVLVADSYLARKSEGNRLRLFKRARAVPGKDVWVILSLYDE